MSVIALLHLSAAFNRVNKTDRKTGLDLARLNWFTSYLNDNTLCHFILLNSMQVCVFRLLCINFIDVGYLHKYICLTLLYK